MPLVCVRDFGVETGKVQVRLVEMNCRQHKTELLWMCNACVGYSALDMVLAVHLSDLGGDWGGSPCNPFIRCQPPALTRQSCTSSVMRKGRFLA